ncbi:hypothetical protein GMORB2_4732 [Geosmithia morbida]|uniref:BZIP domain-containing protein n=1 Tax=Geosmithia morbida TaxID=1094350 RepID=A0A9P4YPK3_9HYPO|nr:uncharacterized protein GMORB2_4732 [Geosmithia morbida]KAF4119467.1 hypothetical protein GMORB2_4732 [Geosmithia morbida]
MVAEQSTAMQPSPADSLLSAREDSYTSLFDDGPESPTGIAMTPAFSENGSLSRLSAVPEDMTETEGGDKKTKKRKSWGQVLPEPKTNLPPRKRAKTEDEKEQRRVERVLRNRRAAQSSRERKRQEVEALERRNQELEQLLASVRETNLALVQELSKHRHDSGIPAGGPSPLKHTLSSQLFAENGSECATPPTVNPASLSPPATDAAEEPSDNDVVRPAVSNVRVGSRDGANPEAGMDDLSGESHFHLGFFGMPEAAITDSHVLESGLLSSPQSSAIGDDYLAGDASELFANQDFDISDWLSEEPNHHTSDLVTAHDSGADFFGLELEAIEPASQDPAENPVQQPEPGASTMGCDVRGIAVGN